MRVGVGAVVYFSKVRKRARNCINFCGWGEGGRGWTGGFWQSLNVARCGCLSSNLHNFARTSCAAKRVKVRNNLLHSWKFSSKWRAASCTDCAHEHVVFMVDFFWRYEVFETHLSVNTLSQTCGSISFLREFDTPLQGDAWDRRFIQARISCYMVSNRLRFLREKLRRYRKTDKTSEKIEFLRKFDLVCGGSRLHFFRKTTWQAFIFHQKKSFKQHTSEIGGGRCNCLLSWRGTTRLIISLRLV